VAIPKDCELYTNEPIPVNTPLRNDSVQNEKEAIFQNLINKKDMVGLKSVNTKSIEEFHLVKEGENLSLIALKYGMTIERLFELNPGLKKNQNKIVKGMKLNISSK
jgi:LysM repeat protein